MKKYILILLVLIIVLFTGCNSEKIDLNNDDDKNEDINKNIDNDENEDNNYFGLKKDELESLATLSKINIDDIDNLDLYYSNNGIYVYYLECKNKAYGDMFIQYTIAGVRFSYPSMNVLYYFDGNKIITLEEAYNEDLLSCSDVVSIYNKFMNKTKEVTVEKIIIKDCNDEKIISFEANVNETITIDELLNQVYKVKEKKEGFIYNFYKEKECITKIENMTILKEETIYAKEENDPDAGLTKWDKLLKKYKSEGNVSEVMLVKYKEGSSANVEFYKLVNGGWNMLFSELGVVGKNGIGKEKEGDKKTPTGEFGIKSAFGIEENPGTVLNYINVTSTVFACDEDSEYYNTIIDTSKVNHNCNGEEMYSYKTAYAYGIQIDYNPECIYPRGSAIFLHVKSGTSTAGCVAISKENMVTVLKNATPGMKICIYSDDDN